MGLRESAEFSPCRTWRYALRRSWGPGRALGFVLLNPSTADETQDDPTVRRCIGFAKALGYDALVVGNLFAYRATDPRALRGASDPVGPWNDRALYGVGYESANSIVCGWGNHGAFMERGPYVLDLLRDWGFTAQCLAMTGAGQPGHPLYLSGDLKPIKIGTRREPPAAGS